MNADATIHIPANLFQELAERAKVKGTSVDVHASELLSKAIAREIDEARLIAEIRKAREEMASRGVYLTEELLNEAKRWGRE